MTKINENIIAYDLKSPSTFKFFALKHCPKVSLISLTLPKFVLEKLGIPGTLQSPKIKPIIATETIAMTIANFFIKAFLQVSKTKTKIIPNNPNKTVGLLKSPSSTNVLSEEATIPPIFKPTKQMNAPSPALIAYFKL